MNVSVRSSVDSTGHTQNQDCSGIPPVTPALWNWHGVSEQLARQSSQGNGPSPGPRKDCVGQESPEQSKKFPTSACGLPIRINTRACTLHICIPTHTQTWINMCMYTTHTSKRHEFFLLEKLKRINFPFISYQKLK